MTQLWKQISIQRRWQITTTAIILLFITAYQFNVKKAISAYKAYTNELILSDSISMILQSVNTIKKTGHSEENTGTASIEEQMSLLCDSNQIDILEMTKYSNNKQNNYTIETNRLVVTGSYNDILKLTYQMEKDINRGINSITWELTKDKLSGEYKLLATIYIKSVHYENHI